jgi:DNA repair exonuclease SbcCD nuclease subunit
MDFTFLHCADLHLGSPLLGLSLKDEAIARRFAQASRDALSDLITTTIAERVAFVLIAGDVYDGEWKDTAIGLFFARELSRLHREEIPVFIIHGNHDAKNVVTSAIPLPGNVTTFPVKRAKTQKLEALRVAIHGRSFQEREETENWAPTYPEALTGYFNIGMLHTSCDGKPGHASYAPCTTQDLVAKGYDYWALGHVHQFEVLHENPHIVYPGNLQGRSIRECGPKGAVFVDVQDGRVRDLRRVITDQARWAEVVLDASGHDNREALLSAVAQAFRPVAGEAEGKLVAARLRLTGATVLHRSLLADHGGFAVDALAAAQQNAEDIWIEKLRLDTRDLVEASGEDLAGVDLDALLAGGDGESLVRRLSEDMEMLRSKSSGAGLALDLEDAPALMAEARALLLERADHGEAR